MTNFKAFKSKLVGPPCSRGPLLLQRELFFCRHILPSSSSIVHLKNCSVCVHKHKILNYHHHLRVIQFSWKIKFVMGPLIQQSTGYEKQPHININGVLKIALKASFWCLFLRVDDKTKCAILIFIWNFKHFSL